MLVKATREGLIGDITFTGWKINTVVPFVALPSKAAVRLWVIVVNPLNNKSIKALVLDIGPWNEDDDEYVFGGARPQAESGVDKSGRPTNKAGIDLGEAVWKALDMKDNTNVDWKFSGQDWI
jgi:hypothetical protein